MLRDSYTNWMDRETIANLSENFLRQWQHQSGSYRKNILCIRNSSWTHLKPIVNYTCNFILIQIDNRRNGTEPLTTTRPMPLMPPWVSWSIVTERSWLIYISFCFLLYSLNITHTQQRHECFCVLKLIEIAIELGHPSFDQCPVSNSYKGRIYCMPKQLAYLWGSYWDSVSLR